MHVHDVSVTASRVGGSSLRPLLNAVVEFLNQFEVLSLGVKDKQPIKRNFAVRASENENSVLKRVGGVTGERPERVAEGQHSDPLVGGLVLFHLEGRGLVELFVLFFLHLKKLNFHS